MKVKHKLKTLKFSNYMSQEWAEMKCGRVFEVYEKDKFTALWDKTNCKKCLNKKGIKNGRLKKEL